MLAGLNAQFALKSCYELRRQTAEEKRAENLSRMLVCPKKFSHGILKGKKREDLDYGVNATDTG